MEQKSRKLAFLTGQLKVSSTSKFDDYLKEVYIDLISRITKNENDKVNAKVRNDLVGITKLFFTKYYSLPGIIGDRLFRVFDSNNDGVLDYNEFKTGMFTLFCGEYDKTLRFIFDFYDFDGDGKISKEDIKFVLLYVTYSNDNEEEQNNDDDNKKSYEKKINNILNICFNNQMKTIKFIEFANIVEKKNSDIYFLIYMFLLKAKPFSYRSIELYQRNELKHIRTAYNILKNDNLNYNRKNSNSYIGMKNSVTLSDININKNFGINKNSIYKSEANINQSNFDTKLSTKKKLMGFSFKDFKVFFKDNPNTDRRRINFRNTETYKNQEMEFFNQDFDNTIFEALLPSELSNELENIQYNEEEFEDILNDETSIKILESESNNYQGYIYIN